MIIELGLSPDQSREINHLPAGRGFGEGQAPMATIGHTMPQTMTTINHLAFISTTSYRSCVVPQASWDSGNRISIEEQSTQE